MLSNAYRTAPEKSITKLPCTIAPKITSPMKRIMPVIPIPKISRAKEKPRSRSKAERGEAYSLDITPDVVSFTKVTMEMMRTNWVSTRPITAGMLTSRPEN